MGFANLHIHTYFSDGCTSPRDLVRHVYAENDLTVFALTDHDTLSGIEPVFRYKAEIETVSDGMCKRFIPGVELSLHHQGLGHAVHLVGLFPHIREDHYQAELVKIDQVLGPFCTWRCKNRAVTDLDGRIVRALELNLDGIGELFDSPETVIRMLRKMAEERIQRLWMESGKQMDLIQHPIPITYQTLIDHWTKLIPSSTQEKITLYVLRPDGTRVQQLARIYMAEGLKESNAAALAKKNQGSLVKVRNVSLRSLDMLAGLSLLQTAGAVTFLAHPAVDHHTLTYEDVDRQILYPLMENGLDGIEVYYPYDPAYRNEAIHRYRTIAHRHGLLVSGGTDFHGDGRTGLSEIKLHQTETHRIMTHT